MINAKQFLSEPNIWLVGGTEVFCKNVAACVNDGATLSPSQQSALTHIIQSCKNKGRMELRDAMVIATWINSCHE